VKRLGILLVAISGQTCVYSFLPSPPKHCKKDIKNITPTLPSPLRGGGLGWGAKDTSGEVLGPSKKPLLPFTCRGENEISENLFATTESSLVEGELN